MRKLGILLMVGVVFMFTSCDKFFNLKIPAPLSRTLNFKLDASVSKNINDSFEVSLSDVPELKDYLDKIDKITVKAINIEILEYSDSSSKNCVLNNGTVKYRTSTDPTKIQIATFNGINLNDYFLNKTKYSCDGVVAEYQKVGDELKNNGTIKLYINGTATEWPAIGKAKITVETEATVGLGL